MQPHRQVETYCPHDAVHNLASGDTEKREGEMKIINWQVPFICLFRAGSLSPLSGASRAITLAPCACAEITFNLTLSLSSNSILPSIPSHSLTSRSLLPFAVNVSSCSHSAAHNIETTMAAAVASIACEISLNIL